MFNTALTDKNYLEHTHTHTHLWVEQVCVYDGSFDVVGVGVMLQRSLQ